MKKYGIPILIAGFVLCAVVGGASAEGTVKPIQLSLFNPAQIYGEDVSIHGVRLNLLWSVNRDLYGVDIGLANKCTGEFKGFQFGLVGIVEGDFYGWQDGWVANIVEGKLEGLQTGIFNSATTGAGVQLGWVNMSESFNGLQLSVVNVADDLDGVQIGIFNLIKNKEKFSWLPLVNWKF